MNKQELIKKYVYMKRNLEMWVCIPDILEDLKQLDEPQKVTVPQFVADWIEYCKEHNFTLFGCLDPANGFESLAGETFEGDVRKCIRWCRKESNNFARAWLDGYEVEKEKRYIIKVKGVFSNSNCLNYSEGYGFWKFVDDFETENHRIKHTKEELIEGGF